MKFWTIILTFVIGVALGLSAQTFAPRVVGPYLPKAILGKGEAVEGTLVRKGREQDRLLLTVSAPQGAILATFKKQVTEIDLLIEEGDTVALDLRRYEPFVDDPAIIRVAKPDLSIRSDHSDTLPSLESQSPSP